MENDPTQPKDVKILILLVTRLLEVAKILLAYWSRILHILVDPGRRNSPRLTPIMQKLRIGVSVVCAKFQTSNKKK
jgi:hypothetical protein